MNENLKYKTVAYAECVDLVDYINTTDYIKNQVESNVFNSGIVKAIDSVLSLLTNIFT